MIRKASTQDIQDIYSLGDKFINNFSQTYDLEAYLRDSNYIILVYIIQKLEAFLIVRNNFDSYELEMIVVEKDNQGKGIGTDLISYFIKEYNKINKDIFLEVATNNEAAIKLYKKFNFNIVNIRKKYYGNVDAYLMKKVF